jgi:hypothetical protein
VKEIKRLTSRPHPYQKAFEDSFGYCQTKIEVTEQTSLLSRRNVKGKRGKRCGVLLKGLSHEMDLAFDAKSVFLAVNASLLLA